MINLLDGSQILIYKLFKFSTKVSALELERLSKLQTVGQCCECALQADGEANKCINTIQKKQAPEQLLAARNEHKTTREHELSQCHEVQPLSQLENNVQ